MAVGSSKLLFQSILKCYGSLRCLLPVLRTSSQFSTSPANYLENRGVVSEKMSRAMKSYLERAKEHEKFIMEQLEEFNLGKKHLANMMGKNVKEMTQADIDEAINYLLPSGLFVPKSRPIMKPPEEVFPKQKELEFDYSGRPFHFLFYTVKPNYSQLLHDAVKQLETQIQYEQRLQQAGGTDTSQTLMLAGTEWLSHKELEKKLLENLFPVEYEKFIEVFERIVSHPHSYLAEDLVMKYRTKLGGDVLKEKAPLTFCEDGSVCAQIKRAKRKTARANVKVKYPGTGKIKINNVGIDYFSNTDSRQQILFPLLFTDMLGKVDVEATVEGGGVTSQAGAIRYGISQGLTCVVSKEMVTKMKVAGLLTRDPRTRERKKPGKEGARRGYTWLKR